MTDFTENGECSNCGECCNDTPCVTKSEVRKIARWLKSHPRPLHRQPMVVLAVRAKCPFRNEAERKCEIYPVRPLVCRTFKCDMGNKGAAKNLKRLLYRKDASCMVSLSWIFLGDDRVSKALCLELVDRAEWLGEKNDYKV